MRSTATAYPSTSCFPHVSISLTVPCESHPSNTRRYLDIDLIETLRSHNLNPKEINTTCPEAWKDIYGHFELPKFFPKGTGIDNGNITYSNTSNHFRLRRAMLPAFLDKALRQQEPLIRIYVDLLMERLREVTDKVELKNMIRWYIHHFWLDRRLCLRRGVAWSGGGKIEHVHWQYRGLDKAYAKLSSSDNLASTLEILTVCGRA